jgi:hypothetical protein
MSKKVGHWLVKPLGPKMFAAFRVDELNVDPEAVAASLDASFEHVANV